jgi:hypothetical protein
MAIAAASGYSQFSGGGFSPVLYAKKAQLALRKSSTVEDITNSDYFGTISSFGDSVKIIKEPSITVTALERGTALATQALTDTDFTMVVDKANYFQFALDDLEEHFTHINWIDLASDRAGYSIRDKYDEEVLGYLAGWKGSAGSWARRSASGDISGTKANSSAGNDELLAANKLDITDFGGSDIGGTSEVTSVPILAGGGAGGITSPLAILNRISRMMDQANVESDGRWLVVDPVFAEVLMDEDSKLINRDFGGSDEMRNGRMPGLIRGFRVYKSNNVPYLGNGAGTAAAAGSETNFSVAVAGHDSSVATAQQINKVETFRSPTSFADVVRGANLYGRKILRPEALFTCNYNIHS